MDPIGVFLEILQFSVGFWPRRKSPRPPKEAAPEPWQPPDAGEVARVVRRPLAAPAEDGPADGPA